MCDTGKNAAGRTRPRMTGRFGLTDGPLAVLRRAPAAVSALSEAAPRIVTGTCPFHFSFLRGCAWRLHVARATTGARQFRAGDQRVPAGISGSPSIIAARANLYDPLECARLPRD